MRTVIIIPARYASTRLPGKPLLAETGKPLIQYSWEQACKVPDVADVIVATDDQRIYDCVTGFGGNCMMTSPHHSTGSARIAEVAQKIECDTIINLQGDEPEIAPDAVEALIKLHEQSECFASTLCCPFPIDPKQGISPDDAAAVKVVLSQADQHKVQKALYFSRARIPAGEHKIHYMHLGIYAFTKQSLQQFAKHPPTPLEQAEKLEQLRILEIGEEIAVHIINQATPGIDTYTDYKNFVYRMNSGKAKI